MLILEQVKRRSDHHQRVMIEPKAKPPVDTAERRHEVQVLARKVINDHYQVLAALKDR